MTKSEGTGPWLRKDGRYEAQYVDARGRKRSVYGRDEESAKRALRTALNDRDGGVVGGRGTVGAVVDRWASKLDSPRLDLAPNTVSDYRYRLSLLPDWFRRRPLDQLEPDDVEELLDELLTTHATSTVAKIRSLLGRVIQEQVRYGKVPRNVATLVPPVSIEEEEIVPLDLDEAAALLTEAHAHRLGSMFTVAFTIGLRKSEAIGLKWAQVDLDAGTLEVVEQDARISNPKHVDGPTIQRRKPKSAAGRRTVVLPPEILDELREWRRTQAAERLAVGPAWSDSGYVWTNEIGGRLEHRNVTRLLHAMCRRAEVRRVSFHTLRHSAGTLMLAAGVGERAIMEILGHKSLAMIRRYQHVTRPVLDDAAERLSAGLGEVYRRQNRRQTAEGEPT